MDKLLEPAELAEWLRTSRNVLLVHVASPQAYAAGHIDGAVLVTPAELVHVTMRLLGPDA